jgi:hypothetical protein
MRRLTVLSLLTESLVEELRLGQRIGQARESIGRQKPFRVQPGVRLLPLKGRGVEAAHQGFVDVFHRHIISLAARP